MPMQNSCSWMQPEVDITELPSHRTFKTLNKYLDYIELLAITSIDKSCTLSMIIDMMEEEDGFGDSSSREGDFDQFESSLGYETIEPLIIPNNPSRNEFKNHLVRVIKYRSNNFGDYWPFNYEVRTNKITVIDDHSFYNIYICLLLSSVLSIIKKPIRKLFTDFHEVVSYKVIKEIFPANAGWSVKSFGANQKFGDYYEGNLYNKFKALAKDLNTSLNPQSTFPSSGGDGGIDAVIFRKFSKDDRGLLPLCTVQSTCTEDNLESKARETSHSRINDRIHLKTPLVNYLIVPRDMITTANNTKFQIEDNSLSIIIDRFRILPLINLSEMEIDISIVDIIDELKGLNNNYSF